MGTAQTLNRSMTLRESSSKHWDEADFRVVFLQHYARIVDILMRLLGDRSHAEEVASDAFWRLYRQPGGTPMTEGVFVAAAGNMR